MTAKKGPAKKWQVVNDEAELSQPDVVQRFPPPPPPGGAASPPAAGPAPAPAGGPVFHDDKKAKAIFVWATVGLLVAAGLGYVLYDQLSEGRGVRAFHDAPTFVLSNAHSVLSRAVDSSGGTLAVASTGTPLDGVRIDIPPSAFADETEVDIGFTEDDDAVPEDARAVSPQVHVQTDAGVQFDGRIRVTIPFDGTDWERVIPIAFDPGTGTWDAAAPVTLDFGAGTVTVEAVSDTIVGLVEFEGSYESSSRTGFDVDRNGWDIGNEGEYIAPGGNALGMASWAKWVFQRTQDPLTSTYTQATEELLAQRVQLASSDLWSSLGGRDMLSDEPAVGMQLAGLLEMTEFPQVLLMGTSAEAEDAALVMGFDGTAFTVYDPDAPGETREVPFNEKSGFGEYQGYDHFGWTGLPAIAAEETQETVHAGAVDGSLGSGGLVLDSPAAGSTVPSTGLITVSGSVTGDLLAVAEEAIIYVGASRFEAPVSSGGFSLQVPVDQLGDVDVFVLAGPSPADRSALSAAANSRVFREAGAAILVTLTWNQATDMDLYVQEPGGGWVYWSDQTSSATGAELDIDDTSGYGPEHYTLDPSEGDTLLSGNYDIWVNYCSGSGQVTGKVTIADYTDPSRPDLITRYFDMSGPPVGCSPPPEEGTYAWVPIHRLVVG